MQTITKQYKSETCHIVRNAYSERCKFNLHGHQYLYEVTIEGPIVKEDGMILDFKRLSGIKEIIDYFDHSSVLWEEESHVFKTFFLSNFQRVLIMKKNPTAENMVRLVCKLVSEWIQSTYPACKLSSVRIWETTTGSSTGNEFDEDDVFTIISEGIYTS